MLGFADGSIALVFILCILSAVLCAVYGIANWNKGMETEKAQILEEADWQKKNDAIENDQ